MPELPEVETIRRDLLERILHKPILSVEVSRDKTVRSDKRQFVEFLVKNMIADINRIGKLLIFSFQKPDYDMLIHLKMTGQLIFVENNQLIAGGHSDPLRRGSSPASTRHLGEAGEASGPEIVKVPNQHTRAAIKFTDGSALYFNDLRVFGYLELVDSEKKARTIEKYGIEPLTPGFTEVAFGQAIKNKNRSIKAVLLDQGVIAGVGNIYADEVCFAAGIRPTRIASKLSRAEVKKLFSVIQTVIAKAIKERGTTFNNYVDPHGRKGNFLSFLKVYGRGGEPCLVCGTKLTKTKVAQRGTVFCSKCQK